MKNCRPEVVVSQCDCSLDAHTRTHIFLWLKSSIIGGGTRLVNLCLAGAWKSGWESEWQTHCDGSLLAIWSNLPPIKLTVFPSSSLSLAPELLNLLLSGDASRVALCHFSARSLPETRTAAWHTLHFEMCTTHTSKTSLGACAWTAEKCYWNIFEVLEWIDYWPKLICTLSTSTIHSGTRGQIRKVWQSVCLKHKVWIQGTPRIDRFSSR